MCAIAGILGDVTDLDKPFLNLMLKIQHHRGPDFTGRKYYSDAFLGHNRLSILDLSKRSNQPMESNYSCCLGKVGRKMS